MTIDNCQLGPKVELKGGFFKKSIFLEKANMGLGAHIREGCILEEEANCAHCVGLKQTILFPFVTLGSLINFCDCLMAGGTSSKNHSEVGSSYIHFNFTPDGDKTTASLIGDVPRGVMLDQPLIFLGGQGGMVGPLQMGYGNVVAAGSVLREDVPRENQFIISKKHPGKIIDLTHKTYNRLARIVRNNILYLANLMALEQWYVHVRQPFFNNQEFGDLLYDGLIDKLSLAKAERIKRLRAMAEKMPDSLELNGHKGELAVAKRNFYEKREEVCELFTEKDPIIKEPGERDRFLTGFYNHKEEISSSYVDVVQSLPIRVSQEGVKWLNQIVDGVWKRATAILPFLNLLEQ
ncbi:MAG: UDP-N-acetylglucosamine pyrophosphorylase [Thermodesulfobacteriota bacterium]|nr:UDP-N-acetylglucosamine pyrophosphorylase [Thermodesulfobacteriota bacterium]